METEAEVEAEANRRQTVVRSDIRGRRNECLFVYSVVADLERMPPCMRYGREVYP